MRGDHSESCGMDARGAASGAGMPLGRDVGVFHGEELERRTLMSQFVTNNDVERGGVGLQSPFVLPHEQELNPAPETPPVLH